jgi:regulator of nucleoside diphosphate kinase
MSLPPIHISTHDFEVLQMLLKSHARDVEPTSTLRAEMARATICDAATLPAGTIGINCRAQLQDLDTGEREEYVLTLPAAASAEHQRVSVLAPVGTALLGLKVGDEITWPTPGGDRRLRILFVKPEPPPAPSVLAGMNFGRHEAS